MPFYDDDFGDDDDRFDYGDEYEGDDEFDDDEAAEFDDYTRIDFANPGSALRAATPSNPRDRPCPNCERPNRLTRADVSLGYQCDACADAAERGCDY